MAEQVAPVRHIVAYSKWALANGIRVTEMRPYTIVHKVHMEGSWHYKTKRYGARVYSLACDNNYGPNGSSAAEKAKLQSAIRVARSMGLAVRYALYGPVAGHGGHLHVDSGPWSNLGRGEFKSTNPGDLVVWDTQKIVHNAQNNLLGTTLRRSLYAVQQASRLHGKRHPYGVKYTQRVIGAKVTGKWDVQSIRHHDQTVKALKSLWKKAGLFKGTVNTTWDKDMDAAYRAFLKEYGA